MTLLSVQYVAAQPGAAPNNTTLTNSREEQANLQLLHVNADHHQNGDHANGNSIMTKSCESIDFLQKHAKMESPRCSHGLIRLDGNRLLIAGGYDRAECFSKCEIYDHDKNKITPFANLNSKRGRAAVVQHLKNIYVFGGSDGHTELNSFERYEPNENKWQCVQFDVKFDCSNVGAASNDEFIFLVGIKDTKEIHKNCLKYQPIENKFTRIASLQSARCQCALVRHKDLLYVFGGHDHIRCFNTCETYNTKENGKWSFIAPMLETRRGCGAAVKDDLIYIVGGTNGSCSLKSTEIYNTQTNKYTFGPELNVPRANVAIAFIGKLFFFE
jgi:influenza virus NS1A-binding protein